MVRNIDINVMFYFLIFASVIGISNGDGGGPRFTVTPPSHVVFSSEAGVMVGCVAEGSPPPSVTWVTREGRPLPNYSPFIDILANGSLVLRPFQPDRYRADVHAATLRCRASNTHGTVISPPVSLQAVVWQDFSIRVESGRAVLGGSVVLKCLIPAHLSKVVTPTAWEMPTHTIYPTSTPEGRYLMVGSTGDLLVRGVTHEDAFTEFKCRVRDRVNGGREMSSREPAKILVLEHGEPSRPSILDKQRSVTVPEGSSLVLPCIATGTPVPTVSWVNHRGPGIRMGMGGHPTGHLNNQHSVGPAHGSDVLVIEGAQTSDSRSYTCTANNSVGTDQVTVEVIVEPRLTVSLTPPQVKVDLGGTATFSCRVSDPAASVSWYYNGFPVSGNGRMVAAGGQLILSSVTRDDPGMYQCHATRSTRAAQQASQLILEDSKPVLQYRFIEQTIQPGPSVSLKCSAVANPTPTISWTLDGLPILQSDRVVVGVQEGSRGEVVGHVNISHTRVEDGGRYQCTASNTAGSVYHRASLNIYGLPVGRPLATVTAVSGQMLELRCPVAGYPLHKFMWNKDGEKVIESLGRRIDVDGTLVLEHVRRPSDAGVYTCVASTKQSRTATGSAQVSVLEPPFIAPFAARDWVSAGERITLTCTVSKGDEPLTLTWLWNGSPISLGGSQGNGVSVITLNVFNSVLSFERVQRRHAGDYSCEATNAAASSQRTYHLVVYVPPAWVLEPRDSHVIRGQSLVVDCAARGYPEPSLTWKKKVGSGTDAFRSLDLVRPRVEQLSNGSLYISGAEPEHAGTYVCHSSNTVTHLSSTINIAVNSAPYFLGGTSSEEIRAGEMAVLECRVKGNAPLTLSWAFRGVPLHRTSRYIESEKVDSENTLVGKIEILSASQSDAGDYTCTALNDFGRNSRIIKLSVHEPPSPPRGLQVISKTSRSVRISWAVPEPSPSSYILQYREATEGWSESREMTIQASVFTSSGGVEISPLIPAASYIVRISAVNHLGRSPASEDLRFTTSPEKPGAAPLEVRAEATGPREMTVSWRPPPKYRTHGTILGFYLGYAPALPHTSQAGSPQYNFTTIERSQSLRTVEEGLRPEEVVRAGLAPSGIMGTQGSHGGSGGTEGERVWIVRVGQLQPYTKYQVVVQAFNSEGSGPLSSPVAVMTREDAPGGAPLDCRCISLSWDSVQVSWGSPDPRLHHGVLKGYRYEYERWDGFDTVQHSQTSSLTAVVTGLEAATNYSIRVRAFNSAGDGPWSPSIVCSTHEDVPGRVAAIKAVVSTPYSFIVSWSPPSKPNGHIVSYKVTWRVVGAGPEGGRGTEGISTVAGNQRFIKVENVQGRLVEVEVVASTREGEGPPSAARVTLTSNVPAAIYSISSAIKPKRGDDVTLPCSHVGEPQPSLVWTYQNRPVSKEGRMIKSDGGLLVQDVQRQDSGNYTCAVSNSHGSDHLTHYLTVLVPPSAPLVLASSSSESSVQVQWKPGDDGGSPVIRYSLYYRKDHGAWTQINLHRHAHSHTLTGLECGSRYHIYVVSHNVVGGSPGSSTAVVRTLGGPPQPPQPQQFFSPNSSSVSIFPKAWRAQGCPISHMVLEYRRHNDQYWIQVSSGWPKDNRVDVAGLEPATRYALRATAVTSAGSSTHSYSFSTLTAAGEVSPVWSDDGWRQWGSLRVLLPLLTSVIALASSLTLVCYCLRRKIIPGGRGKAASEGPREKRGSSSDVMDNKHNMAQREQYYATIRKTNPRDNQSDTAPEDAEDIYPYATFPSSNQANPDSGRIPMMPIYQTHNYDKKNETYGETKQNNRGRGQIIGHNRSRSRGGVADSDDYEMLGSETETEHGGVSSRTESSNQLDDIPSIRDQSVYSRDSVYSGDSARTVPMKDPRKEAVLPKEREGARNAAIQGYQQRIHHNLLYHAESSTSPEPSPTTERKSFLRHARARYTVTPACHNSLTPM